MAKFVMKQVTRAMQGDGKKMYPHLISMGEIGTDEIGERIMQATSLTRADVVGALAALADEMARRMAMGYSVRLDGIGTFRALLALEKDAEVELADSKTKRNAAAVTVGKISFRPDKSLLEETRSSMDLERTGTKAVRKQGSPYTLDERIERAKDFIKENGEMRTQDYARLTEMSISSASRELKKLRTGEGAPFRPEGSGARLVYLLR